MIKFKSIASRIIVSAIPVMAITTFLFIGVTYIVTYEQTNAQIKDKMYELGRIASQEVEIEIIKNANITSNMAIYASNATPEVLRSEKFTEFVRESIESNDNTVGGGIWFEPYALGENEKYFSAYAYEDNGPAVVTRNYSDQVDYHNEIWYLDGKRSKGEIVWSDIYFDPVANVTMVTATQPFFDANGKMMGVTTADMALTDIQDIVKKLKVGATGAAVLLSSKGEYISFMDDSRTINDKMQDDKDPGLAFLGKESMKAKTGIVPIIFRNAPHSIYYDTFPLGWKIFMGIETAEIRSSTLNLVSIMGIVPLIGLALAILCILLVARHIKKVVENVNSFADKAASGDWSERIEDIEADEFGVMEDRLNKMITNMSEMSKKTEEMLEVAQNASKSKSDFLSRMSHEIRTPMNAIIGMTDIALDSESMVKIKDCLRKTQNASQHLLSLINDILDMAKIEANKLDIHKSEFDLYRKLKGVHDLLEVRAAEKNLSFNLSIADDVPQYVISDELRISQIFNNLLGNAIKFTPENGAVSVFVTAIKKPDTARDVDVTIAIRDTGIGLSEESREKLFSSFEQADGGIARKYGGTGLGLAISKNLTELMGGRMWVDSELGKGSTFSFSIPMKRGAGKVVAKEEDEKISDDLDLSGKTILLAEDIAINREIVRAMLLKTKAKIEDAENGLEVIEKFRANGGKYDLILMDMQMPEMGGLEATSKIREMSIGKDVPIIALTANAFQSDIEQAIASGMNGHVAKPIDRRLLMKCLYDYLVK